LKQIIAGNPASMPKNFNLKKVKGIISSLVIFSLQQLVAMLISLPYLFYRIVILNGKKIQEGGVSYVLRKILEFRKTKDFIGINMACILLFLTLSGGKVGISLAKQMPEATPEPTHINTEVEIKTEKTYQMPTLGYVSQRYTFFHNGIDIAGNENQEVFPITNGEVKQVEYSRFGYGINVMVDHGNDTLTRYAHMKAASVYVGQEVSKNSILGYVGSTGWSTGAHLHFEIYHNGRTVNPLEVIPSTYANNYVDLSKNSVSSALVAKANQKMELAENNESGSMSAQVSYKEVVPDFVDPVNMVASGSAVIIE
jgi:peptidase M23-like protein